MNSHNPNMLRYFFSFFLLFVSFSLFSLFLLFLLPFIPPFIPPFPFLFSCLSLTHQSLQKVEVPYGGSRRQKSGAPRPYYTYRDDETVLKGKQLLNQLDVWVEYGTIEQSAADAIRACVDHPEVFFFFFLSFFLFVVSRN